MTIKNSENLNSILLFGTPIQGKTVLDIKSCKSKVLQAFRELGVCQNGIYGWINQYFIYLKLDRCEVI